MSIKLIDIAGKDLQIGDFVIIATKCTNDARLRKGVITKCDDVHYDWGGGLRQVSIVVETTSVYLKGRSRSWDPDYSGRKVCRGTSTIRTYIPKDSNDPVKLEVIKLGFGPGSIFTSEEIDLISKTRKGFSTRS